MTTSFLPGRVRSLVIALAASCLGVFLLPTATFGQTTAIKDESKSAAKVAAESELADEKSDKNANQEISLTETEVDEAKTADGEPAAAELSNAVTPEPESQSANAETAKSNAEEAAAAIASARSLSRAFRYAAEKALPSVVMIKTASKKEGDDEKSIRDVINRTFDGVGSGVIVRDDGTVLTNHHVIADAARIQVRLSDGRAYNAELVQSDPGSDIAILKIAGKLLPTASLGESDSLYVGDWVMAIGSPFALESSVSAGIISGVDRWHRLSKTVAGQFIQTDASINPGNSGGALIDLEGNVIGINTAISSRNGAFQGIGFAIPIGRAKWIMSELENHGRVRRPYAGVGTTDVPFTVARQLELPRDKGAFVRNVVPGYAADQCGLKSGDVVLRFRGSDVDSASEFAELIQRSPVGEPLRIVILRAGEEMEMEITLRERE